MSDSAKWYVVHTYSGYENAVKTSIEKFKKAGAKPFLLAALLYIWLLVGGYLLAKYVTPILG